MSFEKNFFEQKCDIFDKITYFSSLTAKICVFMHILMVKSSVTICAKEGVNIVMSSKPPPKTGSCQKSTLSYYIEIFIKFLYNSAEKKHTLDEYCQL